MSKEVGFSSGTSSSTRLFSASFRVRALKLMVALLGTYDVSGGEGGMTSSSFSSSRESSVCLGRFAGIVLSTDVTNGWRCSL